MSRLSGIVLMACQPTIGTSRFASSGGQAARGRSAEGPVSSWRRGGKAVSVLRRRPRLQPPRVGAEAFDGARIW